MIKKRGRQFDIEFTEQKTYPDNDENAIEFKWSDEKENIDKANLFENF